MPAPRVPLTVVLDTETTGLGHVRRREDGVVQVAAAHRDPRTGAVEVWSAVCDPGQRFYQDGRAALAFEKNGLTPEAVARAPPAAEVAGALRGRLRALAGAHGPLDLRAYNVQFDRPFLEASPWGLAAEHAWGPCLMLAAHARLDPRGKWPRLREACDRLGVAWPGAREHDAGADAHAALLLHEALLGGVAPRAVAPALPQA